MKHTNFKVRFYIDWKQLFFILLISSLSFFVNADSSPIPGQKAIKDFLDRTVRTYNIPGLALEIVNDRGVIYRYSYGESSPGTSITSNTPFLLGSTTKTFTALAIMRLVESGKVDLDSPLKKYLPEFRLATPEYENSITIRHLLNHTSGLSDEGMPYTSLGENSLEDELFLLQRCKPTSAPGVKYAYFNDNYRILGLVIEKVSGMKYGEFLFTTIFKPLSMTSTFAGLSGVKDLAPGHGEIFGFPFRREQKYRAGALPSGYIVSSAEDIGTFLIAELIAGKGDSSLLNPGSVRLTWQPPQKIKGGYAMGWMAFDTIGKTSFLAHGGSLENYQSFFYINPVLNTGFVFLMDQGGLLPMIGGFGTLRNGLIKIIDEELPDDGPGILPVLLILVYFFLIAVTEVILTFRLKSWQNRMERKRKWKRWAGLLIELSLTIFLAYWLYKGWSMFYSILPELFLLIIIMVILGVIRSTTKLSFIIRNPDLIFISRTS